ncbi:MAG: helix-turn-helix transcriptional regulator [Actinobacteria bacterium]|nr:helix-turn-helix transcriptional regulator [Actinomycetota bacterium]
MDTRAPSTLRSAEEYLNDLLTTDREFREEWYANVLGRTFGLAVFTYRTDQGLTQTALGKTLGIPQSQIARIEDGEHTPSLLTMVKVCDALGLELTLTISPKGEARREISKTLQRGVCDATDQVVVSVREAR